MSPQNAMTVPISIEASSRDELTKACILNNMLDDRFYEYFNIQKDGKKWVAWYYVDMDGPVIRRKFGRIIDPIFGGNKVVTNDKK